MDLVVMSAGFGKRFGKGIKQLAPIGPNGETIMEMSAIDAWNAGFERIIFVIRKDIEDIFVEKVVKKLLKYGICVGYVFQDMEAPIKGTVSAVLAAKEVLSDCESFAVINADDYYGKKAFDCIIQNRSEGNFLVGFDLKKTLSKTGTVNRGICEVDKDGYLTKIDEVKEITTENAKDGIASMNMWVFDHYSLTQMEFMLESLIMTRYKGEFLLPEYVKIMLENSHLFQWKVIPTDSEWVGITYEEDVEEARDKLKTWHV